MALWKTRMEKEKTLSKGNKSVYMTPAKKGEKKAAITSI